MHNTQTTDKDTGHLSQEKDKSMHNTQTTDKDTGHLSQEKDKSMHNTQTTDKDTGHLSQEKDKSMHNTQTTDKDTGHLSQEKDKSMHNTQTADNDPGHLSQEKDKSTDHLQDAGHSHKRSTNPDTTQGPLTPQRVAVQSSPASARPWCPSAPHPLSSASLRSCCQRSGGTPRGKPAGARPVRCCRRRMDAASGDVEEKKRN